MEQKQEAAPVDVGAILREARERMGMSVEDVAGRLKFAPRQVVALEEGSFDQLPQMAFVRGFVRSYARLLQIDEAPLLNALPRAPQQDGLVEKRAKPDMLPGAAAARAQNVRWLAGALAVAVIIGILAWQHDGGEVAPKPSASAKVEPDASSGVRATPGEETTPAAGTANIAGAIPAASAAAAAPAPAIQEAAKRQAVPASAVAAARENALHKRSGRLVRLEFDEDSWVEVKDANGKTLLSMLGKQGSSQSVGGPAPLSVTVGNARGVKLYYKGEPVDLESEADGNVAHLILE